MTKNIRLMVVGHARQGKTTLCRRLLNHDVGSTDGTEGIEIYRFEYDLDMKKEEIIRTETQSMDDHCVSQIKESSNTTGINLL